MARKRGGRRGRKGRGRVKSESLNHQLHNRMQQLNKIGQSRHEAKLKNNGTTPGIYSKSTYTGYKQVSKQFSDWIKANHSEIKSLNEIKQDHLIEYLQTRDNAGLSPETISRDLGALNKIFGTQITKKQANLKQRSYKKIERSRLPRKHDKKYNPKNYKKEISLAKATGIRRESFIKGDYRLKEGSIYKHNNTVYVSVVEKGGKFRNAPVRQDMKGIIQNHFNVYERDKLFTEHEYKEMYTKGELGSNLIDRYTTKIDNHAFRREYAQELYKQELSKLDNPRTDYYKKYDMRALYEVSKALGHNRLRVVVENYLS